MEAIEMLWFQTLGVWGFKRMWDENQRILGENRSKKEHTRCEKSFIIIVYYYYYFIIIFM